MIHVFLNTETDFKKLNMTGFPTFVFYNIVLQTNPPGQSFVPQVTKRNCPAHCRDNRLVWAVEVVGLRHKTLWPSHCAPPWRAQNRIHLGKFPTLCKNKNGRNAESKHASKDRKRIKNKAQPHFVFVVVGICVCTRLSTHHTWMRRVASAETRVPWNTLATTEDTCFVILINKSLCDYDYSYLYWNLC